MKTLNIMLSNLGGRVVPIGYEGENLYTRIRINCIEVFSEYPDATVSMVVSPPDGNMYPAIIEKSGVMVIWDITDAVLSSNGSGECQLTFTDGDVIRKSVVFGISINRSLIASGDPPEPVQEWIDKAEQTAQEIAENAANLAKEDIVESYGSIAPAIIETASGAIASLSDGADGMLVKKLTVEIDPVQEGSGDPSPENVRPISGWDSANVSRTGVNVWDEETKEGYYNTTSGAYISYSGQLCVKNLISVKPNTTYYCHKGQTTNQGEVLFYDINEDFISALAPSYWINKTFTTPANCCFIAFNLGSSYGATYNHDVSINYPSTNTQYHAYSGSTAEYEFPQEAGTVYGGSLTIHQDGTGELVVEYAKFDNPSSYDWVYDSSYANGLFRYRFANNYKSNGKLVCSMYPYKGIYSEMTNNSCGYIFRNHFAIKDDSYNGDVSAFKSGIADMELIFELATPITYQLTNQQVLTLLKGNNVCFADCGSVSIEYPADTKLYIDGKVAELQALILENISNS